MARYGMVIDETKCVGCHACRVACQNQNNLRIIKKEGYIEKCRFCIEFVEKGEKPACVTTCMTGVRMFGDLEDPNSEISHFIAKNRNRVRQFKMTLNTKPRI